MAKDLSQLSLEELWRLFPIFLVAPKPQWESNYQEMAVRLEQVLGDLPLVRISHIGSTAIPGIWAKDIVDVLVELAPQADLHLASESLIQSGFLKMSESEGRVSLNAGYTPEGFADKVYHIHLRYQGDHDELYFRDYLREHAQVAKDYEALKLALWSQYEHNRDAYTDAKTDFIQTWTRQARQEYGGRYDKGKTD